MFHFLVLHATRYSHGMTFNVKTVSCYILKTSDTNASKMSCSFESICVLMHRVIYSNEMKSVCENTVVNMVQ